MDGVLLVGEITGNGCMLPVRVGVSTAREQQLNNAGQPIPEPLNAMAMIDTGADRTVLNAGFLTDEMFGPAEGVAHGNDFLGQAHAVAYRQVRLHLGAIKLELHLGEWPANPQQAAARQLIIGRDILARGGLLYDGQQGRFKLYIMLN